MDRYEVTLKSWNKVAWLYQDKFMDLDLYNDTYDDFCQLVKDPAAAILEIGCGPGNITRYLLAEQPGWSISATDASPNMVALARQNNPGAECLVMDARDLSLPGKIFDAIVCGFCLPYLSLEDCRKLFADCAGLLKAKGIFYISVLEGDYARSGYQAGSSGDRMYFYYYDEKSLRQLLEEHNFAAQVVKRKNYREGETHLVIIAAKK